MKNVGKEATGGRAQISMTLSQRAESQVAVWRNAAEKLPRPTRGAVRVMDGVRFSALVKPFAAAHISWEVCDENWAGTGVTFGLWEL